MKIPARQTLMVESSAYLTAASRLRRLKQLRLAVTIQQTYFGSSIDLEMLKGKKPPADVGGFCFLNKMRLITG
jgi:hypothetical protein